MRDCDISVFVAAKNINPLALLLIGVNMVIKFKFHSNLN